MEPLLKGTRVSTPLGNGGINYARMNGSEVSAYSVFLDTKIEAAKHPPFPSYSGTIFPANQVWAVEENK